MLDAFWVPGSYPGGFGQDVQVFYSAGSSNNWQLWEKPRGSSMLYILALGAGGPGGNGFTRAAGNAGGGGAGGGGASSSKVLIPAFALPDRLYIQVGVGGNPGAAGGSSYVSARHGSIVAADLVALGGGGAAGSNGASNSAGAAGSGAGAPSLNSMVLPDAGIFITNVGGNGTNGGSQIGANGGANFALSGRIISGGAGGGGTTSGDFAGGNITGAGWIPTISGGAAGSHDGNAGAILMPGAYPLALTGGSGGGASNTLPGGNGGIGAFGCGGGGGGAGTTGGAGGRGGDGLIIMISW